MQRTIDLNGDLGEECADDAALLAHLTSANVACGFHAGGPAVMARTVAAALARGVAVGAHPGLPDRAHFGRRAVAVAPADVRALMLYQLGALDAFVRTEGPSQASLFHVKPHGALYHMANADAALAEAVVGAVAEFNAALTLYGPPVGCLVDAARLRGLRFVGEGFADRSYEADGTLTPRDRPGALLTPAAALAQALRM
ncbi:MAG: 5-oxoprolinase subunit PxpA, partial [Catalinimonas sp.]